MLDQEIREACRNLEPRCRAAGVRVLEVAVRGAVVHLWLMEDVTDTAGAPIRVESLRRMVMEAIPDAEEVVVE